MPYVYEKQNYTPAPEGYAPFYINHLGRHGSRSILSDRYIDEALNILYDAKKKDQITSKGIDFISQLEVLKKNLGQNFGELTSIGEEQLKGIAKRMGGSYASVFTDNVYVQCDSVERCIESMEVFLLELQKFVNLPNLSKEILPRNNNQLNFFETDAGEVDYYKNGEWREIYKNFSDSVFSTQGAFSNIVQYSYLKSIKDRTLFFRSLFEVNAIIPNVDTKIDLSEFYTNQDVFNLWRVNNVMEYLSKGPTPINNLLNIKIAAPLLRDFLITSGNAVQEGGVSADFRFAHAETVIPMTALLGIPLASKQTTDINLIEKEWLDFQISPMAANIQWIFYANEKGNVLVKMLLNEKEVQFPIETEIYPYYDWNAVNIYYTNLLDKIDNNGY